MTLERMDAFFAARLDGYDEYMLSETERFYFAELERMKRGPGLEPGAFYHCDTPLTAEHEMDILRQAGFSDVRLMRRWDATCTVLAQKQRP